MNTQHKDTTLDEILHGITGSKNLRPQRGVLAKSREEAKQAILAWHNKQIEQAYSDGFQKASKGAFKSQQEAKREAVGAVLDNVKRVYMQLDYEGSDDDMIQEIIEVIEAERNKLKETPNED